MRSLTSRIYRSFLAHRMACLVGCLIGILATPLVTVLVVNTSPTAHSMSVLPPELVPSPSVVADLHRIGLKLPGEIGYSTSAVTGRANYFALNSQWSTLAQNTRLSSISTAASSGFVDIYTGAQPANANATITGTLLCSLPLGATAFKAPSSGTMVNNGAISCVASATGTAGYGVMYKSDHTSVLWMGSVGTSAANLIVPTVAISSGVTVSLADAAYTITDNASLAGQ